MQWDVAELVVTDGGRAVAGYGNVADCMVRAVTTVTGTPYQQVLDSLREHVDPGTWPRSKDPDIPAIAISQFSGWLAQFDAKEYAKAKHPIIPFAAVPEVGRFIVVGPGHVSAVIDGRVHDLHKAPQIKLLYGIWEFIPDEEDTCTEKSDD